MLLLKRKTFELSSASPLVKADEAATVARAEEIVAAAEAEAARIAADAKVAAEAEKKRGYADGIAAGRQEILLQKMNLVDESVAYMERIEGEIADIVIKAMKKCVCEIGERELVVQAVRKSLLSIIRNQSQITIKVPPEMVAVVKERLDSILADFPTVLHADIREDAHLKGATCIVETEAGSVESSVDRQLETIEKAIRKSIARKG